VSREIITSYGRYLYDSKNRLTEIRDSSRTEVTSVVFKYGSNGLVRDVIRIRNKVQNHKMTFIYNPSNRVDSLKEHRTNGVDTLTDYTLYGYDFAGNCISKKWYDKQRKWLSSMDYRYDSLNRMIYMRYSSNSIVSPKIIEYDSSGLECKEKYEDKAFFDTLIYKFNDFELRPSSENLFFSSGSNTIYKEDYWKLDSLAAYVNRNPEMIVEISGHTDDEGDSESNMLLSLARATTVAEYLITRCVNSQRVRTKGYGVTQPFTKNDTEIGKRLNRRVEFYITSVK